MKLTLQSPLSWNRHGQLWIGRLLGLSLLVICASLQAGQATKHGAVMARAMVLDDQGQPILVEYNEDGSEAGVVPIPSEYQANVGALKIVPASEYRLQQARLTEFMSRHADDLAKDADLMQRDQFAANGPYKSADGKVDIAPPALSDSVKSVLVRGRSNRLLNSPSDLVLLSFSVDLTQNFDAAETGSLVLNPEGQVVYSSTRNIAPRVGFFGDPNQPQEIFQFLRKPDDQIFGGIGGVRVYVDEFAYPGGQTFTESAPGRQGLYSLSFRMPYCPGGFDFTTDVWAELPYQSFSPKGMANRTYYLRRQDWTYCYDAPLTSFGMLSGFAVSVNSAGSFSQSSVSSKLDLKVDVMFLSGRAILRNPDGSPVTIGSTTTYKVTPANADPITQNYYDFDGDGRADRTVLGNMEPQVQADGTTKVIFVPSTSGTLQGVFFSSSDDKSQPNVSRVADTEKNPEANGLVESISVDDFKNTDILIFRESTGQLVMERHGLPQDEIDKALETDAGVKDGQYFGYRLMLRGPMDNALNIGGGITSAQRGWQNFGTQYKMAEPFRKQEADHLKSGEWVKIVIINRATGYIGTRRVQLTTADTRGGGSLSVPIEDIALMPPNLKVWAEREYEVENGLTANEQRKYIIGSEGATLTSDTVFNVYTEWYDQDGSPLPEGLGADNGEQYGLTGRLAKVVSNNTLAAVASGNLAEFPIAPGRNTQVVSVRDNLTVPEHFYVHVSGVAKDSKPDFSTGTAEPPLDSRPKALTPFLTPQYDENKSWQLYNAYRGIKRDQASQTEPPAAEEIPNKPLPSYVWSYRPEYQFSQYGLEIAELNRVSLDDGEEEKNNLIHLKAPTISTSDQLIEVLYSLFGNQNDRLSTIDGPRDLVFAVGEQETQLTFDQNQNFRIYNLEHLDSLSPEDFLTMRLYSNQDAGNILWEYAFEYLNVYPMVDIDGITDEEGVILISADEPRVDLAAYVAGYTGRSESAKYDVTIAWKTDAGRLEKLTEENRELASFTNTLHLPTISGQEVNVTAKLANGEDEGESTPMTFRVLPGEAASIQIEKSKQAVRVGGSDSASVTITVRDAHGNFVADDTPINLSITGSLRVGELPDKIVGGSITLDVTGTDFAEQASINIRINELVASTTIDVVPLDIEFERLPSFVAANQTAEGEIRVTGAGGEVIPNQIVDIYTESGRVNPASVTTNDQGIARFVYIAPQRPAEAIIKARIALQPTVETSVAVDYANGQRPSLDTALSVMVGDQVSGGISNYTRFDGTEFATAYEVTSNVVVSGAPNSQQTLSLGDMHSPNRNTLAAFWMNDVGDGGTVADEVGFLTATARNVYPVPDNMHLSGNSLYFGGSEIDDSGTNVDSLMVVADATRIKLASDIGFTLALKPEEFGGELINLGDALVLTTNANGTVTVTAKSENSQVNLTSTEAINVGQWSRLAVHYRNGELLLAVNNQIQQRLFTGDLAYSTTNSGNDLVVGDGYRGNLGSLKWFTLASPPLVLFENGQETQIVSLDGTGSAQVFIRSTGNLQSFLSQLTMQSVAITQSNFRSEVKLISKALFDSLSRVTVEGRLIQGLPELVDNNPSNSPNSLAKTIYSGGINSLVPSAYAYSLSYMDVISIVSTLIGLDSVVVIWDQLNNMVAGRDVDIVSFSVAVLDLLTLFPPAAPLKVVSGPAKLAIKLMSKVNPKAAKYLGGVVKKLYQNARKKDFDLVFQGIAFFILIADAMSDEEAMEGLSAMFSTITSTEDFLTWVEYLSIADPETLPPDSNTQAQLSPFTSESFAATLFTATVPAAHAKVPAGWGKAFFKGLLSIRKEILASADDFMPALRIIVREGKDPKTGKRLRELVHHKIFLKGALKLVKRVGFVNLRQLIVGYPGQRTPSSVLIATIVYLESAAETNTLFAAGLSEFDRLRNERNLRKLYVEAVPAMVGGKIDGWAMSKAFGASHHLVQLAQRHLIDSGVAKITEDGEIEPGKASKILGIEVVRDVPVFKTIRNFAGNEWAKTARFGRRVDIVTGTALYTDETWWEVKSWRAVSKTNRRPKQKLNTWRFLSGKSKEEGSGIIDLGDGSTETGSSPHKQFCLDRIAAKNGAYIPKSEYDNKNVPESLRPRNTAPPTITVSSVNWQFQGFTAGKNRDIVNASAEQLKSLLVKDPTSMLTGLFNRQIKVGTSAKDMINVGAAQELMESLRDSGFDFAQEALKDLPPVLP